MALAATTVIVLATEYASAPMFLTDVPPAPFATSRPTGTPDVYTVIRTLPPAVMLELPVPTLDRLPGKDPLFVFWSILHWNPLVNGYGGYVPPNYAETMEVMRHFPDERSIGRLKRLHVGYLVVHRQFYEGDDYENLLARMASHGFALSGRFPDWSDQAALFLLK